MTAAFYFAGLTARFIQKFVVPVGTKRFDKLVDSLGAVFVGECERCHVGATAFRCPLVPFVLHGLGPLALLDHVERQRERKVLIGTSELDRVFLLDLGRGCEGRVVCDVAKISNAIDMRDANAVDLKGVNFGERLIVVECCRFRCWSEKDCPLGAFRACVA